MVFFFPFKGKKGPYWDISILNPCVLNFWKFQVGGTICLAAKFLFFKREGKFLQFSKKGGFFQRFQPGMGRGKKAPFTGGAFLG